MFRKQFKTETALEDNAPKRFKYDDKDPVDQEFISVALSLVWEDCAVLAEAEMQWMKANSDPKAVEAFAVSTDAGLAIDDVVEAPPIKKRRIDHCQTMSRHSFADPDELGTCDPLVAHEGEL